MCAITSPPSFNQMLWDDMLTKAINNYNDGNNCFPAQLNFVGEMADSLFGCGSACYLETGSVKMSLELIHKHLLFYLQKQKKKNHTPWA